MFNSKISPNKYFISNPSNYILSNTINQNNQLNYYSSQNSDHASRTALNFVKSMNVTP